MRSRFSYNTRETSSWWSGRGCAQALAVVGGELVVTERAGQAGEEGVVAVTGETCGSAVRGRVWVTSMATSSLAHERDQVGHLVAAQVVPRAGHDHRLVGMDQQLGVAETPAVVPRCGVERRSGAVQ